MQNNIKHNKKLKGLKNWVWVQQNLWKSRRKSYLTKSWTEKYKDLSLKKMKILILML